MHFSIEQILQERIGDPEVILTNLGFGNFESSDDLSQRIPERFLRQPSKAEGVSLDDFLDRNPNLKEYVALTRQLSVQSQGSDAAGQYFSSIQELVNYLLDNNVPHRFVRNAHITFKSLPRGPLAEITEQESPNQAQENEVKENSSTVKSPEERSRFKEAKSLLQRLLGSKKTEEKPQQEREEEPMETEIIIEELPDEIIAFNSPGRASRPESLDLQPFGDEEGRLSSSSDSTLTPSSQFYFFLLNTRLSPNETLV